MTTLRVVLLASVLIAVPAVADDALIGDERALPQHYDHAAIAAGALSPADLLREGEELFRARFTVSDGAGRPAATSAEVPTSRPISDTPAFFRTSGPDANACAGCHFQPVVGGAGDFVANVFVAPQDVEYNFDTVAPDLSMERGTTALQGAGFLELLAREMSAELQAQRAAALAEARRTGETLRVPLSAKGVAFGFLTVGPDGWVDITEIQGVHPDLVLKPFSQKAVIVSLRFFSITAFNNHHGMQPVERFGARWTGGEDFDQDGMTGEMTEGDITLASLWQAMLAPPIQVLPDDPARREAALHGERLFETIGCTSCHVPALPLDDAVFTEPGPYNPAGTLRLGEVDAVASVDLGRLWGDYLTVGPDGSLMVPAYTDLKRHRIADATRPYFANEVITQNFVPRDQFRTAPLWGVGSTAPYGHRGDITTLREAILQHGGEAGEVRYRYAELPDADQAAVIEFLKTLQIAPLVPRLDPAPEQRAEAAP